MLIKRSTKGLIDVEAFLYGYSIAKADLLKNDNLILDSFMLQYSTGSIFPPFLVRLGDGEAKLLGYPDFIDRRTLDEQLKIWFGNREFLDEEVFDIKSDLVEAIKLADFIGLPTVNRLKGNVGSLDQKVCSILYNILFNNEHKLFEDMEKKEYCSASIHLYLHGSKKINDIIPMFEKIIVIGSDEESAINLSNFYGIV